MVVVRAKDGGDDDGMASVVTWRGSVIKMKMKVWVWWRVHQPLDEGEAEDGGDRNSNALHISQASNSPEKNMLKKCQHKAGEFIGGGWEMVVVRNEDGGDDVGMASVVMWWCRGGCRGVDDDDGMRVAMEVAFGVDAAKDFKENMLSDYCCQVKLMLLINAAKLN
uniref:Uncharacterized protein n=1 Tax=Tanacetum cinerariifolium TaxID=118510 RepID=A0A6L2JZJ9_TANCI|nr:hypothetical protein [Tanacetum cinerariifolium]